MTKTKNRMIFNKKLELPSVIITAMLLLTALTGLFNQTILSLGIVICMVVLLFCDKLYLFFPFVLFYNSFYGLIFGVSLFRIYTLIILAMAVLKITKGTKIKTKYFCPLLVYIIYLVVVMIPVQNVLFAVYITLDIITVIAVVSELVAGEEKVIKSFFKIYAVVCLLSFLSGTVLGNSIGDEYNYSRFMATFEDPNYMGFFFTVAIFALVTLKLFDKRIRLAMVVALYAMILTTLSVTAIIVNIALWMIYLVAMKKIKWWSAFVIVLVIMLAISLFNYGLNNPDTPVLGDLSARLDEKLSSFESGDMGEVTTGRSDLASEHFEYYMELPLFNMLFGGIPVNTRYVYHDFKYVAHNEYIDMLLNVGLIGAVIMFGYFISNVVSYAKKYKEGKEDKYLFLIMAKTVWMCYAMTLTVFLDFRFMFLFLL